MSSRFAESELALDRSFGFESRSRMGEEDRGVGRDVLDVFAESKSAPDRSFSFELVPGWRRKTVGMRRKTAGMDEEDRGAGCRV